MSKQNKQAPKANEQQPKAPAEAPRVATPAASPEGDPTGAELSHPADPEVERLRTIALALGTDLGVANDDFLEGLLKAGREELERAVAALESEVKAKREVTPPPAPEPQKKREQKPGRVRCKALRTCLVGGMPKFSGDEFSMLEAQARKLERRGDLRIVG